MSDSKRIEAEDSLVGGKYAVEMFTHRLHNEKQELYGARLELYVLGMETREEADEIVKKLYDWVKSKRAELVGSDAETFVIKELGDPGIPENNTLN